MNHKDLPMPVFYDHKCAERWGYHPNETILGTAAHDWRKSMDIKPSAADKTNVHLLLIDVQKDFCHPEGALFVAGRHSATIDNEADLLARGCRRAALVHSGSFVRLQSCFCIELDS